jgi:hypothetical protein
VAAAKRKESQMKSKSWKDNFDERQLKEIEFCRIYAKEFSHGTDGHNAKLIIARFAKMMDELEESNQSN